MAEVINSISLKSSVMEVSWKLLSSFGEIATLSTSALDCSVVSLQQPQGSGCHLICFSRHQIPQN